MGKLSAVDRASKSYFDSAEEDDNEEGQQEMFNDELSRIANALESVAGATKYEIKAAITIKAVADNALPETIPIFKGKFLKEHIEEVLTIFVEGEPFKRRLRAVVGQPSGDLLRELAEAKEAAKAKAELAAD